MQTQTDKEYIEYANGVARDLTESCLTDRSAIRVITDLCARLKAATTPAPLYVVPDPHTGCPLNHGRAHNSLAPTDEDGCLVCTCGFNWDLPF